MKNHVSYVLPLYGGLLKDLTTQWPDLTSFSEKDLSYLRRALEQRGLSFFTITLPAFGHWIDRSMDEGRLLSGGIPRGIPVRRGRPELFRGVLQKVFDSEGMLRSHADVWAIRFLRTLCQSFKKLEIPVSDFRVRKTLKEFYDVEASLPRSHQDTWDSDIPIWCERDGHPTKDVRPMGNRQLDLFADDCQSGATQLPWRTLRALARRAVAELGIPDWWSLRPKHGPGAVSDVGWKSKYDFPNWPRKLDLWFPYDWFGKGELSPETWPDDRELPSQLIAVPKTAKGPRLICKEPIAHQWIQQGIWRWLDQRLPHTTLGRAITLRDQQASMDMALEASHSGSSATLDLSAASDRLSTRLVEYIFQGSELLDGMHACRTRAVKQSLDQRLPQMLILRKFSTMGSALTFPIQSIVFSILSVWALRLAEGRENDWRNWKADFDRVRVYGDDIIVPVHAYGSTELVLHECGLLVNTEKSFKGIAFRESCGMDAFRGVDVTPPRHRKPYDGTPPSTVALIEYSNNLYVKGYWNASDKALGLLPQAVTKRLAVVGPDGSALGLLSLGARVESPHLQRRWDSDLQREYYVALGFTIRGRRNEAPGSAGLAEYLTQQVCHPWDDRDARTLRHLDRHWASNLNGAGPTRRISMRRVRVYPN